MKFFSTDFPPSLIRIGVEIIGRCSRYRFPARTFPFLSCHERLGKEINGESRTLLFRSLSPFSFPFFLPNMAEDEETTPPPPFFGALKSKTEEVIMLRFAPFSRDPFFISLCDRGEEKSASSSSSEFSSLPFFLPLSSVPRTMSSEEMRKKPAVRGAPPLPSFFPPVGGGRKDRNPGRPFLSSRPGDNSE